ncbi:MAG: hypothetical protein IKL09_02240 [Clostridia bacterium]|nr:hypothetical protein [Clostridia bacterium]
MKNKDLIKALYIEVDKSETFEDCSKLDEMIEEIEKEDAERADELDSLVNEELAKYSYRYFELGFKCAMQLRNIGEEQMHHE